MIQYNQPFQARSPIPPSQRFSADEDTLKATGRDLSWLLPLFTTSTVIIHSVLTPKNGIFQSRTLRGRLPDSPLPILSSEAANKPLPPITLSNLKD